MRVSSIPDIHSTSVNVEETPDLTSYLMAQACKAMDKKAVKAWSPCLFTTGRKQDDAISVGALVFDFDTATAQQLSRVRNILQRAGVEHLWHTSFSHTVEKPKWRLAISLDKPVLKADWPHFWARAAEAFGVGDFVDKSGKNLGRFYFVPCGPNGATLEAFPGTPVPTEDLLKAPQQPEDLEVLRRTLLRVSNVNHLANIRLALAGRPFALEGDRDNAVTSFGWYLGRFAVPNTTSVEALLSLLGRGFSLPGIEGPLHWQGKFKSAYTKGQADREKRNEEKKQEKGLTTDWAKVLQYRKTTTGDSAIVSNTYNAIQILRNEGTYHFRRNVLEEAVEVSRGDEEFRRFKDTDASEINNWLQEKYNVNLGRIQVHEQAELIAEERAFDPLQTYLKAITWDGANRAQDFLRMLGVTDDRAIKLYSKKWLISLVARALRPGCKVDSVLVLQGAQGLGKSTALRILTEPWFSDTALNLNDKDALLSASRFWVHEFAELSSFKRTSQATLKAFLTSPSDNYRPPHGRSVIVRPRRCVFVATTNEDKFLEDSTGSRRYWCVRVEGQIDFKRLELERDQLLAEAKAAFDAGELWYFDDDEARKLQEELNDGVGTLELEPQFHFIQEWWQRIPFSLRPKEVSVIRVLREAYQLSDDRIDAKQAISIGRLLSGIGWKSFRGRRDGIRGTYYLVSQDWLELPYRDTNGKVVTLKEVANVG